MPTYENPMKTPRTSRRVGGFTLIELMITVAILAILAAVALPAYKEQIARGKRSDVQTVLIENAAYMQRYYAANNSYVGAAAASMPAAQSPRTGTANYTIADPTTTQSTFTLTATPVNSMASDKCGNFTYDNLGQKGVSGTQSVSSCWR